MSAGRDDAAFKNVSVELFLIPDTDAEGGEQMRGFTVSPDGRYIYGGFLQGYRHITKFDAMTGERLGEYEPAIENDDGVTADCNYPKSIAIDCRGYMFAGITLDEPASPYIGLVCVDSDMNEVSYITENLGAAHTGITGIAAQKIGDRILVYIATNYDRDTLRCYDVTDVGNMHLYSGFGVDGVIDYNELTGSQADPGYMAVDVDGYIYLCYLDDNRPGVKGSTVVKLEKDGKSIIGSAEVREAYGICTAGDYLFISNYDFNEHKITVLNKSDLSKVTEFAFEGQNSALSGCSYGGDCLWIGAHGDGVPGEIYRTNPLNITRDNRETETVEAAPNTHAVTEDPVEEAGDTIVLFDFTDPLIVSRVTADNDCEIEYDEQRQCMKVTVKVDEQGEVCDPYFTLPMTSKSDYFDGDKYKILILRYISEFDTVGEIYFKTKINRNLPNNHIMYDMDEASEWNDLEIDMRDDDQGNWEGQVRSIRIDPTTSGEDGDVFYFKSISATIAKDETFQTEPETIINSPETEPEKTNAPKTEPEQEESEKTSVTKPNDTKKTVNGNGFPVWAIIVIAVCILALVTVIFMIIKKRKK
ncbi:MAG: hypothetical protein J6330_08815 [Clostridia bacterium]|nr:hypothetical protein [Clostridia bacterium]